MKDVFGHAIADHACRPSLLMGTGFCAVCGNRIVVTLTCQQR